MTDTPHDSHEVPPDASGMRLDVFLTTRLETLSRSRVQSLIRSGAVTVGGAACTRPSEPVEPGALITVEIPSAPLPATLAAEDLPLDILHEDSDLIVLNKPPGLVVHPGAGVASGTLVNALLHHCAGLSAIGGEERPGIVHRLDKETSGCLVVAKNDSTHRALSEQFAGRAVEKTYLALADGTPRHPHGTIDAPIGRHKVHRQKMAVDERGRSALTLYKVLGSNESRSLVACQPKTGRTHQIRVHLKHLGHPVCGDPVYGRRGAFERHLLHAWKLGFKHPKTGRSVAFCAPLPPDFPAWARELV